MPRRLNRELEKLQQLRDILSDLVEGHSNLSTGRARKLLSEISLLAREFDSAYNTLSDFKAPIQTFDPADPETIGKLIGLALIAQRRHGMAAIPKLYGSGIYAIYYIGLEPIYAPLRQSETPIYVGKADPDTSKAVTPREQGSRLFKRVDEHRRTIERVENYANQSFDAEGLNAEVKRGHVMLPKLRVTDFEVRMLVCTTNAQLVAERQLIELFQPIWNETTRICWGFSKHGDAAETRLNKRSPWHVIHRGSVWALNEKLTDAKAPDQILNDIRKHFAMLPTFSNQASIISAFLITLQQT